MEWSSTRIISQSGKVCRWILWMASSSVFPASFVGISTLNFGQVIDELSGEKGFEPLGWPGDDPLISPNDHGPFQELRVFQEDFKDLLAR